MKLKLLSILLITAPFFLSAHADAVRETIPLGGEWDFQLDGEERGIEEEWFNKSLNDTIQLPGTTDEAKKGIKNTKRVDDRLSRPWKWIGAAWYQRKVEIPDSWAGKRITLTMERTKDSRVWVDGQFCAWNDSLSAPHVLDLSDVMTPGTRTLTILIDNARVPPVAKSHAIDERTQTNWNGIIGEFKLEASAPVWLEEMQIYPDIDKGQARVRVVVGNRTGKVAKGEITLRPRITNVERPRGLGAQRFPITASGALTTVDINWDPGVEIPLWDEFNPALVEMGADLAVRVEDAAYMDVQQVRFGMREISRDRNKLLLNGEEIFLRGRIDCCFYPLTGYPPMDREGWLKVIGQLKEWGLNHARYHSWTPPSAAFEAADELGFYFQAELPNKSTAFFAKDQDDPNAAKHNIDYVAGVDGGTGVTLYDYAMRESEAIMRHYGNSPSFTMYTLGNEMGRRAPMYDVIAHLQRLDPRHLYAQGSNNMHWKPSYAEGDDFWVAKGITDERGKPMPLRGAYFYYSKYQGKGHIDNQPPSTMVDYSQTISGVEVPMIVHENAEFEVFPNFSEIPKFTGVTRGWNYELFRERLDAAGMLDQADDFMRASGALSAICKREDIESSLRTPDLGGYQLLDIQDFAGQGTALVGLLDVFMDSKGIITPEERRRYCSPTVPLLRMKQFTWTQDETLRGRVQVSHFGPDDLEDAVVRWSLHDAEGKELAGEAFEAMTLQRGRLSEVDIISASLREVRAPQKLTLWLEIEGTGSRNDYPLWVYPGEVDTTVPEGVLVAERFNDPETREHLDKGGAVLLLPEPEALPHSVMGSFRAGFWSPMFLQNARRKGLEDPPVTLGALIDPEHPAFKHFPTEYHSNWQWWYLTAKARPIILNDSPKDYRPLVQMIDSIGRMHKLGLMFETKVGKGRLFVCAAPLQSHLDQPEVRQMYYSLLRYMDSKDFEPSDELDAGLLETLLP